MSETAKRESESNSAAALSEALQAAVVGAEAGVVGLGSKRGHATSGTVWTADGVIVTSHRGTMSRGRREAEWIATGPDEREREVEWIGRDPATDIALLRIDPSGLEPLARIPADASVAVGTLALALARPGWKLRASLRLVGLVGPSFRTPQGGRIDAWLETDRSLPSGFSGGPLIDVRGRMLGLDTRGLVRQADLAIPIATLDRIVAELLTHGQVMHGWIGISLVPVVLPRDLRDSLGLAQRTGVLIAGLEEDGPAAKGGALLGDVLLELAGRPADDPAALREALIGKAGKAVTAVVLRGGQRLELSFSAGERPS